jgi:hypothetical protein
VAAGVIGLVAIVPIVAVGMAWALGAGRPAIDLWSAAALALTCAVVIGPAVVHWAVERGRVSVAQMMLAGGLAGALPPVFAVLSAIIGLVAQGGMDYAVWVFEHGASVPWYGSMHWLSFARLLIECAAIGAISAAIVTPLVRARRTRAA